MAETPKLPINKTRDARLYLRMPADVKATIRRAADLTGETLGDFVVNSAHEAAEQLIRERVINLSPRDSALFFEAILSSTGPNDALLAAARRHRELFGPMGSDEH